MKWRTCKKCGGEVKIISHTTDDVFATLKLQCTKCARTSDKVLVLREWEILKQIL